MKTICKVCEQERECFEDEMVEEKETYICETCIENRINKNDPYLNIERIRNLQVDLLNKCLNKTKEVQWAGEIEDVAKELVKELNKLHK